MANSEVATLEQCLSLPITAEKLKEIVQKAKDWAIMHGTAMRSKIAYSSDSLDFAPFILVPSSLPRKEFDKVIALQPIINRLIHHVAHDEEFITTSLAETIKVDDFTKNLFTIYKKVLSHGSAQTISLGLLRNDVMLEVCSEDFQSEQQLQDRKTGNQPRAETSETYCWKQVEINTIASGFGHIGPASKALQSFVLEELGHPDKVKHLPENNALAGLCDGMLEAWRLYGNHNAGILFVIEDVTYNICDQRFHEFYLRKKCPHIEVVRRTLTQIYNQGKLGMNKELLLDGLEIAVIYFRAGYEPKHYHGQNEWDARYLMESSRAIKSPSIHYHLAGTKKIQQELSQPGMLERFISDPDEIKAVYNIFTGLYTLDDNEVGNANAEMALKNPERFVLKPQREGGCNNIYDSEIFDALKKMSTSERSAFILMDRILPIVFKGYMIRPGDSFPPQILDLVSELGIFGVIIGDKDTILTNYQAGHMLRTKLSTANEGGVASGLGALDSPYLID